MAKLVIRFGWTWVGTVSADDDYGKYGIKAFTEEVEAAGVCIAFSETLPKVSRWPRPRRRPRPPKPPPSPSQVNSPEDIQRIVQTVVESTARIVVVFSSDVDLRPLVGELLRHNVTNRTWLASEAWVTSALVLTPGVSARALVWEPGPPESTALVCVCVLPPGPLAAGGHAGLRGEKRLHPGSPAPPAGPGPVRRPAHRGVLGNGTSVPPKCPSASTDLTRLLQVFNCTLDYGKALRRSGPSSTGPPAGAPPRGLCSGLESLTPLNNTYSDVSQLRITYR